MQLDELPADALRAIYEHAPLPFVLKRVCRALRDAGPSRTVTTMAQVTASYEALRVAVKTGCPFPWDERFAKNIAWSGDLRALMWARKKKNIPWDECSPGHAAHAGNLEMVQWLKNMDCPFDSKRVSRQAAQGGHLHILKWLHTWDAPMDQWCVAHAAKRGDLELVKWLVGIKMPFYPQCLDYAAMGSGARPCGEHVAILGYLRVLGVLWNPDAFTNSVESATMDVLKWMRANGCVDGYPAQTLIAAAQNGRRDVLEWLVGKEPGYAWDHNLTRAAARRGHLALLAWLRAEGCAWGYQTAQCATQCTDRDVRVPMLRWIAANGGLGLLLHREVPLDNLRRELVGTPSGPVLDCMAPGAVWVHGLIRWRKLRAWVRNRSIAVYWQGLAPQP
jgi:hypothetical protein